MNILGIETSCDETAASVVRDGQEILSNIVATSAEMHVKTGGIIPEQAARKQVESIIPVIQEALGTRNLGTRKKLLPSPYSLLSKIDAIAVTVGPGLIGSLLVGVETAKTLSFLWKKPLIPVNHLIAHIYANWFGDLTPKFPLIALVVSGGHTDLVYMKQNPSASSGQVKLIGTTRDDAAGECFDKCARILGLPYPGGPAISAAAEKFEIRNSKSELKLFPRPLLDQETFAFSFSGLKTAVLNEVKSSSASLRLRRVELAAQVQEAIVDVLVEKTLRAAKEFKPKSLLLGGGVAANFRLKEKFALAIDHLPFAIDFRVPEPKLCTDNGAVIASCAFFNNHPVDWREVSANPELTIVS